MHTDSRPMGKHCRQEKNCRRPATSLATRGQHTACAPRSIRYNVCRPDCHRVPQRHTPFGSSVVVIAPIRPVSRSDPTCWFAPVSTSLERLSCNGFPPIFAWARPRTALLELYPVTPIPATIEKWALHNLQCPF